MSNDDIDLSDWEVVDNRKATPKKNIPKGELSNWQIVQPVGVSENPPPESFGEAVLKAPYRVGEDLYKGAAGFIKDIPSYLNQAKTEVPGLLNPLNALLHPVERSKQALAGALELGQKINQWPKDIADYAANRLNLIPQEFANKIPVANSLDQDIEKYIGNPKNPGDAALRGLARNIDTFVPGAKLVSALNPLNMTNKAISKQIIRETNRQVNRHTRKYNNLFNHAERTGFNEIPVNRDLIDTNLNFIRQYKAPLSYRGIEHFSEHPTLQNAQSATSDLKKITRSLEEKSHRENLTTEERHLFDAAHHMTQEIENNMFRNEHGIRNENLANRHRMINSSYRENAVPYRYNENIQKYLNRDITAKQLVNSLSENEFGAKKMGRHPSLVMRNTLPKALLGTGSLGGLGWLFNEMFGNGHEKTE